jgi:hypothetical protein
MMMRQSKLVPNFAPPGSKFALKKAATLMTDEESKRISDRFDKLTLYRKQATVNILFDEARDVWLVRFMAMSEDKE